MHFAAAPESLAHLIPEGLDVDTHRDSAGRESAWIGIVGFRIEGTRTRFGPPLPWLGSFSELNVRTYVRHPQIGPGVLFLSLDSPRTLTNLAANRWFRVPYIHSFVRHSRAGNRIVCEAVRFRDPAIKTKIVATLGEPLPPSVPGSLEHFLTERYRFFSGLGGGLWAGEVDHAPYRLRRLDVTELESSHPSALGLPIASAAHSCYAERVDSAFFPLERIGP